MKCDCDVMWRDVSESSHEATLVSEFPWAIEPIDDVI